MAELEMQDVMSVAIRGERGSYNLHQRLMRDAVECSYPG